jgi:hypothetical protein
MTASPGRETASVLYPFGIENSDSSGRFTDCDNGFTINSMTVNSAWVPVFWETY